MPFSYHGGIDNRERSLFQGGWTSSSTSSSLLHFCYPPFSRTLRRPPSSIPHPADRGDLSRLQIGLVVLRVHQDNSCLALCLFQENRASGGRESEGDCGGGGTRRRKGGEGSSSRAYCTALVRAWFMFWPFRDPRREFRPFRLSLSLFSYFSLSLARRDTLDKCKQRIVETSRINDPRRNLSRRRRRRCSSSLTPPPSPVFFFFSLFLSPPASVSSLVSQRNCSIVALDRCR